MRLIKGGAKRNNGQEGKRSPGNIDEQLEKELICRGMRIGNNTTKSVEIKHVGRDMIIERTRGSLGGKKEWEMEDLMKIKDMRVEKKKKMEKNKKYSICVNYEGRENTRKLMDGKRKRRKKGRKKKDL